MKNGTQLLQLNKVWFKLPENFNGSLPDAIRELAKYLESDTGSLPATKIKIQDDPWYAFMEVENNGGRMSGMFGRHEYDESDNEVKDLPIVLHLPIKIEVKE